MISIRRASNTVITLTPTPRFARRKELFDILYGTMPMSHIDRRLWDLHKDDMLAGYRRVYPVRARIGFGEMTNRGWLTPDRSAQFTDWDSGDRVIVDSGDKSFFSGGDGPLPGRSFSFERRSDACQPLPPPLSGALDRRWCSVAWWRASHACRR
jgi:hypothetical protein